MPASSVPNTFVTGTQVIATAWNENFAALVAWLNTYAIQKDASVAFTALPSIPTTTPTLDAHVSSRKYVNDTARSKSDITVVVSIAPGSNLDSATTDVETDWFTLVASQLIPSWAVKCYIDMSVLAAWAPTAVPAATQAFIKIGSLTAIGTWIAFAATGARQSVVCKDEPTVSSIAGTSVAIKLRAKGTGNTIRIDTSSRVVGTLRFST